MTQFEFLKWVMEETTKEIKKNHDMLIRICKGIEEGNDKMRLVLERFEAERKVPTPEAIIKGVYK